MSRRARACDSCRIRKVKCDNCEPCMQCVQLDLPCVISTLKSRRKNPVRGRLVAMARGFGQKAHTDNQAPSTRSCGPIPSASRAGSPSMFLMVTSEHQCDFFVNLLPHFERAVYPFSPVISPQEIYAAIHNAQNNMEDRALIFAFAAATMFLTKRANEMHGADVTRMEELMQLSLEAHDRADHQVGSDGRIIEEHRTSVKRIMTCIFLEISMMGFRRYSRSFALLREAITMIEILQAEQRAESRPEAARFERLYWEAYIHERFLTVASGYPSILHRPRLDYLEPDSSIPAYIELGFNRLISLFTIMDEPFLAYWKRPQQDSQFITAEWIENKLMQLDEDETDADRADRELRESGRTGLTELQHVDLFITRLWLRILVWQLALSRGLLQSSPPEDVHEGLYLDFPVHRLSTQLRGLVGRLGSFSSVATQGSGIVHKLFDVTSTVADVLALTLGHHHGDENASARVDDLVFLVKFLFRFERIREEQKNYLREKISSLLHLYPDLKDMDLSLTA